ncbi:MAG: hypothetical protein WCG27_08995 [Pseudomonadota bacterium]
MVKIFLILITLPGELSALWAGTFSTDQGYLENAFTQAGLPSHHLSDYRYNYLYGPAKFRLPKSKMPWTAHNFRLAQGGVARRWKNKGDGLDIDSLKKFNKRELLSQLTSAIIANFSPVEKYDLWLGDYTFAASLFESKNRAHRRDLADWAGFCNGMRVAGVQLPEPQYVLTLENPDGLVIPFYPEDLKALAAVNYNYVEKYAALGSPTKLDTPKDQMNIAVFDMALRSYLGEYQTVFFIDRDPSFPIFNVSIIGYQRRIIKSLPRSILVETTLEVVDDIEKSKGQFPTQEKIYRGELSKFIVLHYKLALTNEGKILDGVLVDGNIDFAWFAQGRGTEAEMNDHGNHFIKDKKIHELFDLAAARPTFYSTAVNLAPNDQL